MVALESVEIDTEEQIGAVVRSNGETLILPSCGAAAEHLLVRYNEVEAENSPESIMRCIYYTTMFSMFLGRSDQPDVSREELVEWFERQRFSTRLSVLSRSRVTDLLDVDELLGVIRETRWTVFDPAVWEHRER